jgi:hypothetical protein
MTLGYAMHVATVTGQQMGCQPGGSGSGSGNTIRHNKSHTQTNTHKKQTSLPLVRK